MAGKPAASAIQFISRHGWAIAAVLFIGLFVPLLVREWALIRVEGLHDVKWHSVQMTRLLQRDLEFDLPLDKVLDRIDKPEHYAVIDRNLSHLTDHLGLLKIKIFNRQRTVIYSTDPTLEGKTVASGALLEKAFSGQTGVQIVKPADYRKKYGETEEKPMAEVYTPLLKGPDGRVAYVLEAYYDYTPFQQHSRKLLLLNGLSLGTIILIFIMLHYWFYLGRRHLNQKVAALEALLPICQHCKKIRIEEPGKVERWQNIESYFADKGDVEFSHGICNECMQRFYPDILSEQERAADTDPARNRRS